MLFVFVLLGSSLNISSVLAYLTPVADLTGQWSGFAQFQDTNGYCSWTGKVNAAVTQTGNNIHAIVTVVVTSSKALTSYSFCNLDTSELPTSFDGYVDGSRIHVATNNGYSLDGTYASGGIRLTISSSDITGSTQLSPTNFSPPAFSKSSSSENFDFTISTSGSLQATAGSTVTAGISVGLAKGSPSPVTLKISASSDIAKYISVRLSTNGQNPSFVSQLALKISPNAPAGTYSIKISGQGGAISHYALMNLIVSSTKSPTTQTTPSQIPIVPKQTTTSSTPTTQSAKFKEPPVPVTVRSKDESIFNNFWQKTCSKLSTPLLCKDISLQLPTGKFITISFDGEAGQKWSFEIAEVAGVHVLAHYTAVHAVATITSVAPAAPYVVPALTVWHLNSIYHKIKEDDLKSPVKISTYCPETQDCSLYHFFLVKAVPKGPNDPYEITEVPTIYDPKTRILSGNFDSLSTFAIGTVEPSQSPTYTLYQNSQYGLSVQYPQDWTRTDHYAKGSSIVGIGLSPNKSLELDVAVQKNNNLFAGFSDQKIFDSIQKILDNRCAKASVSTVGYTCSSPGYKTLTTSHQGKSLYVVGQGWTKTLKDGTSSKWISVWSFMPLGNDLWALTLDSSVDDYNKYENQIVYIGNSLNISSLGTK